MISITLGDLRVSISGQRFLGWMISISNPWFMDFKWSNSDWAWGSDL
jgi:hypothetical protein